MSAGSAWTPRRAIGLAAKLLVSAALFGVLCWTVDLRAAARTLAGISIPFIAILLVISVVMNLISCLKWQLFLRARGADVPLWRLFLLYLVGYFFNNIMPGAVGGDVVRSYVLGREIGSQAESFGAVFLERYLGFICLIGVALVAVALKPAVVETLGMALFLALLGAVLIGMVLVLLVRPLQRAGLWVLGRFPARKLTRKLEGFLHVVFYFRGYPRVLAKALAWSALFHLMTIVNTQASCLAIGVHAETVDLAFYVPLALLVSAVPVSLNSIGLMEGAMVYFLGKAGVSAPDALAVSLVLRAKNLIMAGVGGLVFAFWREAKLTRRAVDAETSAGTSFPPRGQGRRGGPT